MPFDPYNFGPVFGPFLSTDRCRPLDEGDSALPLPEGMRSLTTRTAFDHAKLVDQDAANCCLAGVWLLYDRLHESHTLSQSIDTREGSFWHGIMHRREGDFGNSKYWFRRVGEHPVFEQLAEQFGDWDPYRFVDDCQAALRDGANLESCLERQQAEWEALFEWCYAMAVE